jgi:N-acetylglutamate synthase/N-acetylornithine aminotransferase
VALAEDGRRRLDEAMAAAEVEMRLDLAPAGEVAEIFFCDLGPEYVRFNSEYTT